MSFATQRWPGFTTIGTFEGITIKGGMVTPAMAAEWLKNTINRPIKNAVVTAYMGAIARGEWPLTNTGLAFDVDGVLYDGQHRLWAIVKSGKSVMMLVFIGFTQEQWEKMDIGRPRSIPDRIRMFRPNMKNVTAYSGFVSMCTQLIVGQSILIKTFEDFDRWDAIVGDGVEAMLNIFRGSERAKKFCNASFAGALAFAHKTNPKDIGDFAQALADGEFKKRTPVWWCDGLLSSKVANTRAGGTGRIVTVRKVLNCARAYLSGAEEMDGVPGGSEGHEYFHEIYETRTINALSRPWRSDEVEVKPLAKSKTSNDAKSNGVAHAQA